MQCQHNARGKVTVESIQTDVIYCTRGTIHLPSGSVYNCLVLLSNEKVYIFDAEKDILLIRFRMSAYQCHKQHVSEHKPLIDGGETPPTLQNENNGIQSHAREQERAHKDSAALGHGRLAATTHNYVLPKFGGKVVTLVHDPKRQECYSFTSHSHNLERYLEYNSEESLPQNEQLDLLQQEKYVLTFADDNGEVFESLFNHCRRRLTH